MSFKAYEEYEDSGIEWLGEVPAHWEIKRIRHLFTCLDGKRVPLNSSERHQRKGNIPYWGANKIMDYVDDALFDEPLVLLGEDGAPFFDRQRDVAFSSEGPVWPNNHIHVLKPHDQSYVSYTVYSLNSTDYIQYVEGSTRDKLTQANMMAIPLAWPDRCERTNIAAFLDHETARIDALIEEQQRLIALLKEKRQAVISHAVTKGLDPNLPMKDSGVEWLGDVPAHWEVIAIKWLSIVQRGASPRPINDPIYFDDNGEYSWVRIADVSSSNGSLNYTPQKLSKLGSSMSVKINPGELFVSIAGTVGKPCISKIKACIHDGFVYFPQLKIPPRFLYTIFESGLCYKGLGKMGTQLNLNTDTIGGIKVAIPPSYDEITQILDSLNQKLKNIDDLASQAGHVTSLLQERRSALISAAVTGKIDVRDWQPPKDNQTAAEPAEASA